MSSAFGSVVALALCAALFPWVGSPALAQSGRAWVDPPPAPIEASPQPTPSIAAPTTSEPTPPAPARATRPRTSSEEFRRTLAAPEPDPEPVRRSRREEARPAAEPAPSVRLARPRPPRPPAAVLAAPEPGEMEEVASRRRLARPAPPASIPRPSFNCRYARTSVERAVCADSVLAAKDRRMAILYERAGGSRFRPVDPIQWSWLAARNRCGKASGAALETCVHRAYDGRIAELSGR
jgi:hypothetical protein